MSCRDPVPLASVRAIAGSTLSFVCEAVYPHHAEEKKELFPAVPASARAGAERDDVQAMVDKLTRENRRIESRWAQLGPALKAVANGKEATIDAAAIVAVVDAYSAHACFEEQTFLPLTQEILGRNRNHLSALWMSLDMRHAKPQIDDLISRRYI